MRLRAKLATAILLIACGALVLWVRLLPLETSNGDADGARSPDWTYVGEDGREHVYLGDLDSYLWLRHARTLLRTGDPCDATVDGECRDTHTNAPVGARTHYARSLHVEALAGLHRLLAWLGRAEPLPTTAFLLTALVGVAGVVPAFFAGRLLAGITGGVFAVVLTALEPLLVGRTVGGDNDVWSVVLPLYAFWLVLCSLRATSRARCLAWAVLAGACIGLHAWAWRGWVFFFVVLAAALAAVVVLEAVCASVRAGELSVRSSQGARRAALVLAAFGLTSMVAAALTPEGGRAFDALVPAGVAMSSPPSSPIPVELAWPNALGQVAELRTIDLRRLTALLGGVGILVWGWLGVLLLFLPREPWRTTHRVVLAGGIVCAVVLVRIGVDDSLASLVLLGVPLVAALVVGLREDGDDDRVSRAAGLALLLWFAGAAWAVYGGVRFYVLAAPPVGIACAVVVGHVSSGVRTAIRSGPLWYRVIATGGLTVVLGIALLRLASPGYEMARSHRPRMNDAWWDTLSELGRTTPTDAIVYTWWDQGHWAAYVADRRVVNDGSSLQTHVPYWMSRALLAPNEAESIGILRMLACGSDALPLPEGEAGAYAAVRRSGRDPASAFEIVGALVRRDVAGARQALVDRGFTEAEQEDVLRKTHCAPPEGDLVLTTELLQRGGALVDLARSDPRHPSEGAVRSGDAAEDVPFLAQWLACEESRDGTRVCPIGSLVPGRTERLEAFRYREDAIDRAELVLARKDGSLLTVAPALLLVAEAAGLRRIAPTPPTDADLGVLIDPERRRILVGAPVLLESTLVQLLYLEGRFAERYEQVGERKSAGERVSAWRIRWPEDGKPSSEPNISATAHLGNR